MLPEQAVCCCCSMPAIYAYNRGTAGKAQMITSAEDDRSWYCRHHLPPEYGMQPSLTAHIEAFLRVQLSQPSNPFEG